jgi:hypothetical protein
MSKEITASGKMSVGRFEKEFESVFNVRIEIKVGNYLADNSASLASLRPKDFKGAKSANFKVAGNMLVGNVKKNILKTYGLTADLYHGGRIAPDDITLSDLRLGNVKKKSVNKIEVDVEKNEANENKKMENYTYICAYDNENNTEDFLIKKSCVVKTNGEYTLVFELETDGDGVIDTYYFYDLKNKVKGSSGCLWTFEEFMDANDEYTEHESIEAFGYKSDEISEVLEQMKEDFVEKYLNEESQERLLDKAAISISKRDMLTVDDCSGNLIFEEGDKNILPSGLTI